MTTIVDPETGASITIEDDVVGVVTDRLDPAP
jgi:hypothetical protein